MTQPRGTNGQFSAGGSKLTAELATSIVEGVSAGLFDAQNALRHGIDVTTLKSWIDRGIDEDAEEPFKSFAEAYIKALIQLEEGVIGTILAASDEYKRLVESTEEYLGSQSGGDYDSADFSVPVGLTRKTKKETAHLRGDWKAAAWYAERRWPLRWGITRQPEGGPKEMIKLPDAPLQRRKKVEAMVKSPPPELIKAFRDAGYELVKRDKAP